MADRSPRPGEPDLNLLEGRGKPLRQAKPPPRWEDMTPIQKGVVIVALGCAGAITMVATIVFCVWLVSLL